LGELGQELNAHAVIGIDTAPFIYLWERHPRYLPLCETLFRYLGQPQVQGITSVITLIETCVYPLRQGRLDLVQTYERALLHSRQVRMLPADALLARRAVALRAHYDIHVPDALQIAAARQVEATAFVTNDRRLAKVQDLHILILDDFVP
jgi:predicted nucleic acid-binding protein